MASYTLLCFELISILFLLGLSLLIMYLYYPKKVLWLKVSLIVIISIIVIGILIYFPVNDQTGEVHVKFKPGVTRSEINETIDKYGYSIISLGFGRVPGSNQTHYDAFIKVPEGKETEAKMNLEKEEIVTSVYYVRNDG